VSSLPVVYTVQAIDVSNSRAATGVTGVIPLCTGNRLQMSALSVSAIGYRCQHTLYPLNARDVNNTGIHYIPIQGTVSAFINIVD
jgi:hypothetical protein